MGQDSQQSPKTTTEHKNHLAGDSIQTNILVAEESLKQMQASSRTRVQVINKRYSGKELINGPTQLDIQKQITIDKTSNYDSIYKSRESKKEMGDSSPELVKQNFQVSTIKLKQQKINEALKAKEIQTQTSSLADVHKSEVVSVPREGR